MVYKETQTFVNVEKVMKSSKWVVNRAVTKIIPFKREKDISIMCSIRTRVIGPEIADILNGRLNIYSRKDIWEM